MRLVSIDVKTLKNYTKDKEMLQKAGRPCVLIIMLKYKGRKYDFAVPLRSNIAPDTPKDQYFALPPRKTTKPWHRHGIHYSKMFPIKRSQTLKFRTDNNVYEALIKGIIDQHEKEIIKACQTYLNNYEAGIRPKYSTDIDFLIGIMNK